MKRWLTLTATAVVLFVVSACSHPPSPAAGASASATIPAVKVAAAAHWWTAAIDQAPFCGPGALLRRDGGVEPLGDCAGLLIVPPARLTLTVGERIDVHLVFSLPRSSDPAVLAQTTVSPDRRTATYQALRPGHATLISARGWCIGPAISHEVTRNCPVLAVTVRAAVVRQQDGDEKTRNVTV